MQNIPVQNTPSELAAVSTSPALQLIKGGKTKDSQPAIKIDIVHVRLTDIRTDGNIRARVDINPAVTAEYAQAMKEGALTMPVVLFYDGDNYWLADGYYRFDAARHIERTTIAATIREGGQREARLFALRVNWKHGERYTRKDRRNVVSTFLNDPEWADWSNRKIAQLCGVSEGTIRNHKKQIEDNKGAAKKQAKPTSVLSNEILNLADHLSFINAADQVNLLLSRPLEEQKEVIEILKGKDGKQSVYEAILEVKRTQEAKEREVARKERVEAALQSGLDDHFVHGDCAEVLKDREKLAPQSVRLLLADGPYGIGYTSSSLTTGRKIRIPNDRSLKEALDIHRDMLVAIKDALMPDCHIMLFCDKKFEPEFRALLVEQGYKYKDSLIWDKEDFGRPIQNQAFRCHERIIWFTKGKPQIIGTISDVLRYPRAPKQSDENSHLTPKPQELLEKLIKVTTVEGELVVDPFAGTASTLVSAFNLGRSYFGVEQMDTEEQPWFSQGTANLKEAREEKEDRDAAASSTLSAAVSVAANTYQDQAQDENDMALVA